MMPDGFVCHPGLERRIQVGHFFAKIALAVRSIGDLGTTKKDNPDELSRLVDHIIELSNPVIEGFMKVVEFSREN